MARAVLKHSAITSNAMSLKSIDNSADITCEMLPIEQYFLRHPQHSRNYNFSVNTQFMGILKKAAV